MSAAFAVSLFGLSASSRVRLTVRCAISISPLRWHSNDGDGDKVAETFSPNRGDPKCDDYADIVHTSQLKASVDCVTLDKSGKSND